VRPVRPDSAAGQLLYALALAALMVAIAVGIASS
jgi:hypothetical protein